MGAATFGITVMRLATTASTSAVLLVAVAASACSQTAAYAPGGSRPVLQAARPASAPVQQNPNAQLNGRWVPTDAASRKIYFAQFRNGQFASKDPGSGAAVARGTYRVTGADSVAISYSSSARKSVVNVDCKLQGPDRMACSTSTGGSFSLKRA